MDVETFWAESQRDGVRGYFCRRLERKLIKPELSCSFLCFLFKNKASLLGLKCSLSHVVCPSLNPMGSLTVFIVSMSLILYNSSVHAFSSLLSIFPYAMMETEYLGSAEFYNYLRNQLVSHQTNVLVFKFVVLVSFSIRLLSSASIIFGLSSSPIYNDILSVLFEAY